MSRNFTGRESTNSGTESAARVADVLLALSLGRGSIGVTDIAREVQLSKAVVHRILQSLMSRDLVEADPETREYRLGRGAIALGGRAFRQLDLRGIAREPLIEIRNLSKETTTLSLLVVDKRTYIDQYESPQEIKMTVELGRLQPLGLGASGRAVLAFLPDSFVNQIIDSSANQFPNHVRVQEKQLKALLMEVREKGYAVSKGERQADAGSVAAPIFGGDGRVMGSMSVCGPLARFDDGAITRYIPMIVSAARAVSTELSGSKRTPRAY